MKKVDEKKAQKTSTTIVYNTDIHDGLKSLPKHFLHLKATCWQFLMHRLLRVLWLRYN